jgi:cyclophilin family peptidyl-prolyl cis-trans isomerase/HEAT repeat protein
MTVFTGKHNSIPGMGKAILIVIAITVLLWCCAQKKGPNQFSDPVFVKIADYQDRRLSDSLYQFLTASDPHYRSAASLAFASIQDSLASPALGSLLLEDTSAQVRVSAAFALGQTGGVAAVNALIPAVNDPRHAVVREVLEALGKTATRHDIEVLKTYAAEDTLTQEGIAWGLYRLGLRNKIDSAIVARENEYLTPKYNSRTRLAAAHFFGQSTASGVTFEKNLIRAALHDPLSEVRMAAVAGLRKLKNDNALETLKEVLDTEKDYRVRVSAARSLPAFPLEKIRELLAKALADEHTAVAIAASEIVQAVVHAADARLIEQAHTAKSVRVQANLYRAIFATGSYPPGLVGEVKQNYIAAPNNYQKAAWLGSLSAVTNSYGFIADELLHSPVFVIRSAAAQALTDINHKKDFPAGMKRELASLYRLAIVQGDPPVVGIISETLSDPVLGYKEVIDDFAFLYEAKKKLQLPKDIESLQPLENAIAYFEGKEKPAPVKNAFNHPVDWNRVATIDRDQRVRVRTTRGDIVLRLLVEEAPGSVANFINLVNANYFDGRPYHRVVPNFVIQTGCNRGDGFGSEDYSIRSEFTRRRYKTGSVGMASAGKDTEGTQWFITHSPTPHLDGRYTVFAEVEQGMEIVDQIDVGDLNTAVTLVEH